MLREPAPLPIGLWCLLGQFAIRSQNVGVPFAPLARAPSRRVGWDVHKMDDFPRSGTSFQPNLHVRGDKHASRSREGHRPPYVIKQHLGETPITQGTKALGKSGWTKRRLVWRV